MMIRRFRARRQAARLRQRQAALWAALDALCYRDACDAIRNYMPNRKDRDADALRELARDLDRIIWTEIDL
jgi:hypothetical protein